MSKLLPHSLEWLKNDADRLNELSDDLAGFVRQLEHFMSARCSIGIPVTVPAGDGLNLSYQRHGQTYRVCIGGDRGTTPWSDAPRELKVSTAAHLPKLVVALRAAIQKMTKEIEAALAVTAVLQLEEEA